MVNPIKVLESAGVDDCRIMWEKRIVQLNKKEDLQKVMNQFPELQITTFAVNGWTFTAERLEERFTAVP